MRLMSFALTTEQVRNRTKTVTRRVGWASAKAGDVVQPVVKGQGIPKGGKVERIGGPIRFVNVSREPLDAIAIDDVGREGFHGMSAREFVCMFMLANGCLPDDTVTRIEFEYLDEVTS